MVTMVTARTASSHLLPTSAHFEQPWRIHAIAPDFTVEDVWALPTPGGPDDFARLVKLNAGFDSHENPSFIVQSLFQIRWKLGAIFGWDGAGDGVGKRVRSLRDRLPEDLSNGPRGPETPNAPFSPVYLTHNEFVDEYANKTVHLLSHHSWVVMPDGSYRGQMAILVKPNGWLGKLYLAAIKPFRAWLVYPAFMRQMAKDWQRLQDEQP
ncbi:DUF2867 domain-containing protein [Nocardioidaceae bacterium SCSIO 66511]|nr:DUF2867 domain-containing protein [Nocardioidaceae bacterium SCSIO 66511]